MAGLEACLEGLTAAMVTPYKSRGGPVDGEAASALASWLLDGGVDCILVGGTTGELTLLGPGEEASLVGIVRETVGERAAVIGGLPPTPLESSVEWARRLVEAGADALLVPPPHYIKGDSRGILAFYTSLASKVDHPIILYNIPLQTGIEIPPEILPRLVKEHSNIVALKATTYNPWYVAEAIRATDGRLKVLAGVDESLILALTYGASGAIVASANVVPTVLRRLVGAWKSGQYSQALEAQEKVEQVMWALRAGRSLQGAIKAALSLMGLPVKPHTRPPLPEEDETSINEIKRRLGVVGLL
jgi:4-hydroxy-tetrahydrodipicolinate synthase